MISGTDTIDTSPQAFLELERRVREEERDLDYIRSRDLDLAIFRALTGVPWRWSDVVDVWAEPAGRHVITWDEYGAGAPGNPVASLDPFNRLDAVLDLRGCLPANARPALRLMEDGQTWEASIVWQGQPHPPIMATGDFPPMTMLRAILLARADLPPPVSRPA